MPNGKIPTRAQISEAIANRLTRGLAGVRLAGEGTAGFQVRLSGGVARSGSAPALSGMARSISAWLIRRTGSVGSAAISGRRAGAQEYEPHPDRSSQHLW